MAEKEYTDQEISELNSYLNHEKYGAFYKEIFEDFNVSEENLFGKVPEGVVYHIYDPSPLFKPLEFFQLDLLRN